MRTPNYDKVIDALYADVLAPQGFQRALLSMKQEFETESCWIVVWNRSTDLIGVAGATGVVAEFQVAYESHYQHIDPAKEKFHQVPVGQWWIDSRELGTTRMRTSSFHQEFLRSFEMASYMGSPVVRSEQREIALSFLKSATAGLFTVQDARSIERVIPHLRNAVLLRERFAALASVSELSQFILERVEFGVAVIDAQLHVLLENSIGRAWLAVLGPPRVWARRNAGWGCSFQDLIRNACKAWRASRPQARALRTSNKPPCYVVLLPLAPWHHFLSGTGTPAALVLFYSPTQRRHLVSSVLRDLFSLTPAECRLALKLMAGSSLEEVGGLLRLRRETVRSMLKCVFQKTGSHSQAQLIRLLTMLGTVESGEGCYRRIVA